MNVELVAWIIVLAPLIGAMIAGLGGHYLSRKQIQSVTLLGIAISFFLILWLDELIFIEGYSSWRVEGFTWFLVNPSLILRVGLWIDSLTVVMMTIVLFISLLVHIYSMDYMKDDPSVQRFFSYLSLFTFAMLTLVGADNCVQLFFGWEAVGFVSYLLIGFWFTRAAANVASLKAFLVNRVADIGFLLGMGLLLKYAGSLEYQAIFKAIPHLTPVSIELLGYTYPVLTVIGILLFIGAIGKSAQLPLQIWLPDSMIGPTPVSALMHAATMVTAGIYMVGRLSPLFESAPGARDFMLFIGSTTALLFGIVALVQTDIKRIIAFSTISQLGYMTAGLGVSAYSAAIFHLATHACFKALLFLAAGSVIIASHHEQNINKMGNQLWKQLPITYGCFIIASIALIGIPPFSGFYSKDMIIEAVYKAAQHHAILSLYALGCLLASVVITALYTSRLIFSVFHQSDKTLGFDKTTFAKPGWWIKIPLIILAIPSIGLGWLLKPQVYSGQWLKNSIIVNEPSHQMITVMPLFDFIPALLGVAGILIAAVYYVALAFLPVKRIPINHQIHVFLNSQYGMDKLNQKIIIAGVQWIAKQFAILDTLFIDRWLVQNSVRFMRWVASYLQSLQSGYLYHYLLMMIATIVAFLIGIIICV